MNHETLYIEYDDNRIYGQLYKPEGSSAYPLVIYSHGYGYNFEEYSMEVLANHGIAAFRFDFCGGSPYSKSTGKSTDMSVVTECRDLEAVCDTLKDYDFIDENNIFLSGNSQGGYVSTLAASRNPEYYRALYLLCPAYVIDDFGSNYSVGSGNFHFGNILLGQRYLSDAKDIDIYNCMKNYERPVTIYHGTDDTLVPISYARKAIEYFPNAKLIECHNAGHMLGYTHQSYIENNIIKSINDMIK